MKEIDFIRMFELMLQVIFGLLDFLFIESLNRVGVNLTRIASGFFFLQDTVG